MKIVLMLLISLLLILGLAYGLAKVGVIPVKKFARSNPAAAKILITMKLVKPADLILPPAAPPPAPVKSVETPRRKKAKPKVRPKPVVPAQTGLDRLAKIYSQLDPSEIAPIIGKMKDPELLKLFGKMSDDQVGAVLIELPQNKALSLSRLMAAQKSAR